MVDHNDKARVYLHGNLIAEVCNDFVAIFDGGWQTVTTKSRLNALLDEFRPHVGVVQKNFDWFIVAHSKYFPFVSGSLVWQYYFRHYEKLFFCSQYIELNSAILK